MLFERLRKARGLNFRDLTFENFKGINVTPEEMWIEYADHRAMRYFEEQVLRKRPYLKREWCELALKNPRSTRSSSGWANSTMGLHRGVEQVFTCGDS